MYPLQDLRRLQKGGTTKMSEEILRNNLIKEMNTLTQDIHLHLAKYGGRIEDIKVTRNSEGDFNPVTFFISVPETSDLQLNNGEEAAGETLAKYSKEMIKESFGSYIVRALAAYKISTTDETRNKVIDEMTKVQYKIRPEDHWDRTKEEQSTLESMIYTSMALNLINEKVEG